MRLPDDVLTCSCMTAHEGRKVVQVAIGIVIDRRGILICRRKNNTSFGGYWEFPGGKVEEGETPELAVARELLEELEIHVTPLRALKRIEHDYPKARVVLHPFICRLDAGEPVAICASEFAWVEAAGALRAYRFPKANLGLIEALVREGVAAAEPAGIDLPAAGT